MAERDGYEQGTPCWVDHGSDEPERAVAFYRDLLGWEAVDAMPPEAPGSYFMCTLRGLDVAAVGSQPERGIPAAWTTYIAVDDADAVAAAAQSAGATVLSAPFDVFDAGRMAVLRDPGGAVVALWQARRHRGARLVNEPGALIWNELTTRDVDGSRRFYEAVFGWRSAELEYGGTRYFTWHRPGAGELAPETAIGGMMPMEGEIWPADLPPHWMTYFATADADATAARCRELGGTVSVAPFDTPAGRIAVLVDPVGAVVSVIQPPEAGGQG